jgi:hypothetical protein
MDYIPSTKSSVASNRVTEKILISLVVSSRSPIHLPGLTQSQERQLNPHLDAAPATPALRLSRDVPLLLLKLPRSAVECDIKIQVCSKVVAQRLA